MQTGTLLMKSHPGFSRARAVFGNLRHLWRRTDISLLTKGRVYNCTVRPTLILYLWEHQISNERV